MRSRYYRCAPAGAAIVTIACFLAASPHAPAAGSFRSGVTSAAHSIVDLIAQDAGGSRSNTRHLENALRQLLDVLDGHGRGHHGHMQAGFRHHGKHHHHHHSMQQAANSIGNGPNASAKSQQGKKSATKAAPHARAKGGSITTNNAAGKNAGSLAGTQKTRKAGVAKSGNAPQANHAHAKAGNRNGNQAQQAGHCKQGQGPAGNPLRARASNPLNPTSARHQPKAPAAMPSAAKKNNVGNTGKAATAQRQSQGNARHGKTSVNAMARGGMLANPFTRNALTAQARAFHGASVGHRPMNFGNQRKR